MAKELKPKKQEEEFEAEDFEEEQDGEEEQEEVEAKVPRPMKSPDKVWVVQDIPTQSQPMIVNLKTQKVYQTEIAIAEILNKLELLMKLLD